ncbi:MAG: hypothetical protein EPO21_12995 [Chloroflexota bacterium]|nr:MAG: hypothetical protein EPO21_12995 [Chloroflexota bacterium]
MNRTEKTEPLEGMTDMDMDMVRFLATPEPVERKQVRVSNGFSGWMISEVDYVCPKCERTHTLRTQYCPGTDPEQLNSVPRVLEYPEELAKMCGRR